MHLSLPQFCIQWEGMIIESKVVNFTAEPSDVFSVLESMGGEKGWWGLAAMWRLRGWIDRLIGGEGFVRFRTHKQKAVVGGQIDYFDIENVIQSHELLLKVRFKLPGEGWMQFKIDSKKSHRRKLAMTIFFAPKGFLGLCYWYSMLPFHRPIFNYMLKKIVDDADSLNKHD